LLGASPFATENTHRESAFNPIVHVGWTVIKGLLVSPFTLYCSLSLAALVFLLIMVNVNVNNFIATAEKTISAFSANSDKDDEELECCLVVVQGYLAYLHELHKDFHNKIEQFGPEIPAKYLDGHELTIRNRCFGDGRDPNNCGRWFVKVSILALFQQAIHHI
jgi:hypothetical protein